MIYTSRFKLLSADVDMRRRLRLSRLFTMLQEAAIAHTEALGMGREKTLDRGILWAVALQRVRVNRLPEYDELVELATWPGETMHVLFPRYSRLTGEGGEVLAESSALWILMDENTRSRVFPEQAGVFVPGVKNAPAIPLPRALSMAKGEGTAFGVPYSYADINGHMNNARLMDLAEDVMPDELRKMNVREIEAEYCAEARPGDRLTLRSETGNGLFRLSGEMERPVFKLALRYE